MGVTRHTLDTIKTRPLSTLVEKMGGTLKRVGREYVTHCLWHEDANPSLTINDDKGFCFCHVCRGGGDAVDYVRQKNGMDLQEAAEIAAGLLGVPFETDAADPEADRRRREERKKAIEALEMEHAVYRGNLKDPRADRIRDILSARGITPAASKEFGLGYAASGYFGGRITVPIYNHRSELVGFTGRATKPEHLPKYKNSADCELFQKKHLVFNEQKAKDAARKKGYIIFVEGHLDVVAMWQAGFENVVAMQGTAAPDPFILERLARSAKNFVLLYDGDAGGKKATEQFIAAAGPLATAGKLSVKIAALPQGQDPDEFIRSGGDMQGVLDSAPNWLDWVIDDWAASLDKSDTAMVTEVEARLKEVINKLKSKTLRAHYIDKAARILSQDNKEAKQIAADWSVGAERVEFRDWRPRTEEETRLVVERRLVRTFVHCADCRDSLRPLMEKVQDPALEWLCERLRELEEVCVKDLTPHSVMAVVAVAEPHFMEELRPLIQPRVIIDTNAGVLQPIADTLQGVVE